MNNLLKIVLSVSLFMLASVSLFVFRAVPSGRLWEGFRVLFVSSSFPLGDAVRILEENGVSDSVHRSGSGFFDAYFSDADNEFNLIYVPDYHGSELESAVSEMKGAGASDVGLDGSGVYDVAVPVFCLLFFFALFVFSPSRIEFSLEGALAVLTVFSRPFPALSFSVCVSLFALAMLLRFKRGSSPRSAFSVVKALKSTVRSGDVSLLSVLVVMFAPVVVLFFVDFLCAISLFLSLATAVCILDFCDFSRFGSAKLLSSGFFKKCSVCALLVVSFFLGKFVQEKKAPSGSDVAVSSPSDSSPSLPSPVSAEDASLPCAEDFAVSEWNRLSCMYRPLGEEYGSGVQDGDSVSLTEYSEVDGAIVAEERKALVFNNDFRKMVYDSTAESSNSMCGVLLSQSSGSFGYSKAVSSGGSSSLGKSDVVSLVSCLLLLLVFAGYHLFLNVRGEKVR